MMKNTGEERKNGKEGKRRIRGKGKEEEGTNNRIKETAVEGKRKIRT